MNKKIWLFIWLLTPIGVYSQDLYYPYVDSTAVWYVEHEIKLMEGGSISSGETFISYEKHYFQKDSFVDGIQFYKACVEFMGLDTVLEVGYSYEIDSLVYAVSSIEQRKEHMLDYDFTVTPIDTLDVNGYILNEYNSFSEELSLFEGIGYGLGYRMLVYGETYYYDGEAIRWSINNYHTKEMKCLCYERDGKVIYKNSPETECWPRTVGIRKSLISEIEIPNPLTHRQEIEVANYSTLQVINLAGVVIKSVDLRGEGTYDLEPSSFRGGLYFIKLIGDGYFAMKKIQIR